ncbi:uncharacterized protein [Typha latifolia]|uniref:uncharacterized protein n=1 Tax=Typha latifolia TaxID=4733 RepID=UPI003C2D62BF
MGNCGSSKPGRPSPTPPEKPALAVRLYGSDSCPIAWRIRISLLYKGVAVQFLPSDSPIIRGPLLRCGADVMTGSAYELLQYVDSRFPRPPEVATDGVGKDTEVALAVAARLQHRSVERHVDGMVRRAAEMAEKGGGKRKTTMTAMTAVAERSGIARWYGELVELMLEHAQMEERLVFPTLERIMHRGVREVALANEQHARDLPMMNGIKEDIKSLMAMEVGTSLYQEGLQNLVFRLKTLQEHCKEHFQEEERELLPLFEAACRARREERDNSRWLEQMMGAMGATHSHLFPFFMAGLLPQEAMQYVDLVCRWIKDSQRVVSMLRSLTVPWEEEHTRRPLFATVP